MNYYIWLAESAGVFFGMICNGLLLALRYGRVGELRWWFRGMALILFASAIEILTVMTRTAGTSPEAFTSIGGLVADIGRAVQFVSVWGWLLYAISRNGNK